jgi:hypothetical protein
VASIEKVSWWDAPFYDVAKDSANSCSRSGPLQARLTAKP